LGLDELGVDSGGSGDNSALVAGRQLGDDVYLRYKQGLFDDFAGLELIYRITERFRLRTETGTAQSIDLLYERNRTEDRPLAETESGFEDAEPKASTD
jgi:translocation and assembly module TamB